MTLREDEEHSPMYRAPRTSGERRYAGRMAMRLGLFLFVPAFIVAVAGPRPFSLIFLAMPLFFLLLGAIYRVWGGRGE